ncbi:MAG: SIMPL domain-containing protein [Acidobacteria bacterium]|nr:SIMPL domain-containing protein [Acidobacteriota bacterium]
MKHKFSLARAVMFSLLAVLSSSCSPKPPRRTTRLVVMGEASTQAQPDTAVLRLSVVTQNQQALTAQQENARKTEAVISAVQATAGASPEIKTSDYNLQPHETYSDDRLPSIIGYEARNSVLVTMSNLNNVGGVIDAATKAGANSIENVAFTLRDNNPARSQALSDATRQAMSKAQSIAQALGGRVARVVEEREGGAIPPPETDVEAYKYNDAATDNVARRQRAPTPVAAGTLNVSVQVHLTVEIETP